MRIGPSALLAREMGRLPFGAVDSPPVQVSVWLSLGCHLLEDGLLGVPLADAVEVLAVDLREPNAAGLVGDDAV